MDAGDSSLALFRVETRPTMRRGWWVIGLFGVVYTTADETRARTKCLQLNRIAIEKLRTEEDAYSET